jgi:hypothetical protein
MPPIPTRTLKPHPLPAGATWFLSQKEAATHPGIQVDIATSVAHFYGVYRDIASLSHHTRNFLIRNPGAETYEQVESINHMYFEFPLGLRRALGIPLAGRWFTHEKGALAAAAHASEEHHIASMILRAPNEDDTTVWGFYRTSDAFVADLAKCCVSLRGDQCLMITSA